MGVKGEEDEEQDVLAYDEATEQKDNG